MFLHYILHTFLLVDIESKKCKGIIIITSSNCHYLFSLFPKEKIQLGAATVVLVPVNHEERNTYEARGAKRSQATQATLPMTATATATSVVVVVSQSKLYRSFIHGGKRIAYLH